MDQPTGAFERLYAAGKEILDNAKKPFVKKALKRKLQSAYDDAAKRIIAAEVKINKAREDFENYNINSVLEARQEISTCTDIQSEIKAEYAELFATEMKTDDED